MGLWKLSASRRFYICTFNSSRFVTTATNLIISGRVSLITIHNLYASTNKTEIIQIQTKPKSFKSKQNPNHSNPNKTQIIQIQTKPKSFKSKQNPNHSNPNKTQITANHSSTGRVSKATTQRKLLSDEGVRITYALSQTHDPPRNLFLSFCAQNCTHPAPCLLKSWHQSVLNGWSIAPKRFT